MAEPKYLEVNKEEKTETVKGEQGTAQASGSEGKELQKQAAKNQTVYNNEQAYTIIGQEAKVLVREEKQETIQGERTSSDPVDIEERILGEVLKLVGINGGQRTESVGKVYGEKKNIVNTISVKEVKALIRKVLKNYQPGGSQGGGKIIDISLGITEEIANEILNNPGTLISYNNRIYVPCYENSATSYTYVSIAIEETIYWMIIDFESLTIVRSDIISLSSGNKNQIENIDDFVECKSNENTVIGFVPQENITNYQTGDLLIFNNSDFPDRCISAILKSSETNYRNTYWKLNKNFSFPANVIEIDADFSAGSENFKGMIIEDNEIFFANSNGLYTRVFDDGEFIKEEYYDIHFSEDVLVLEGDFDNFIETNAVKCDGLELLRVDAKTDTNDIKIEKIYLSYLDKRVIRANYLVLSDPNDLSKYFTNDSTRIFYNFVTSPISPQIEQEIKNGKFVIRLDYPTKNNRTQNPLYKSLITHMPMRKTGSGVRSFAYTFDKMKTVKKQILLRSLIFVTPEDVFVNSLGQKYIHKQISFYEYIINTTEFSDENEQLLTIRPISNEYLNETANAGIIDAFFTDVFQLGLPSTITTGIENDNQSYTGKTRKKYYLNGGNSPVAARLFKDNYGKLNPIFSCYCALRSIYYPIYEIRSPYYINRRNGGMNGYIFNDGDSRWKIIYKSSGVMIGEKRTTNNAYMSARPRCAILSDNYETNKDRAFIKTFSQADQQIRLYCKAIVAVTEDDLFDAPIFRTMITQK